jgi:hypothetical protein
MKNRLAKYLSPLAISASLLTLVGCASGPDVRANFDQKVDFSQYKTFGFASPLGTDRGGYQSLVSQSLKTATQREMEARGLRLDTGAPQLLVNFNGSLNDKLRVSTMPAPYPVGGYYGYRGGMYSAWPMYADQTVVSQYTEGTLNVDVIDAARKQLVWEGVVTDSVSQKDMNNVQPALDAAIAAAFSKYPVPVKAR